MKIELQSAFVSSYLMPFVYVGLQMFLSQHVQLISIAQLMTQLASSVLTILREIRLLLLSVTVWMATSEISITRFLKLREGFVPSLLMNRPMTVAQVKLYIPSCVCMHIYMYVQCKHMFLWAYSLTIAV